jgi:serine protease Do
LAIVKIVDVNFDGVGELPYNFKTRSSDVGTKVYAFGYPMALSLMGKEIKVTDGMISSKTGFDGNITTYQITAPIQGGNSGGPLFDEKGNLIGINSSGLRSDVADNVAYSIKTSYILNLIDILPKSIELPSIQNLNLYHLQNRLRRYLNM